MTEYIFGSGNFVHPQLGTVSYIVRRSARRVVARWSATGLQLSVPPRMTAADLERVIRQMLPRLLDIKPSNTPFAIGDTLDYGDFTVRISTHDSDNRSCVTRKLSRDAFEISLPCRIAVGSPEAVKAISKAMRGIAKHLAPSVLLPRARRLADEIGRQPLNWEISTGRKILGHCNSRRTIALSYALVFLPGHLRDYIIYHELAHLSEMNHSAAFHKICNNYCGGNEKRYIAELKAFRFPFS